MDYGKWTTEELEERARTQGLTQRSSQGREGLIAALNQRDSALNGTRQAPTEGLAPPPGWDLPDSYGRLQATLVPQNPGWLFVHWDLDAPGFRRMGEADGGCSLRLFLNETPIRTESVCLETRRHYLSVPSTRGRFRVEVGGVFGGTFVPLVSSNGCEWMALESLRDREGTFITPSWLGGAGTENPEGAVPLPLGHELSRGTGPGSHSAQVGGNTWNSSEPCRCSESSTSHHQGPHHHEPPKVGNPTKP